MFSLLKEIVYEMMDVLTNFIVVIISKWYIHIPLHLYIQ